jgi:orotidine-5'-phosphate decarboxylase
VCSGLEVRAVKAALGRDFLAVTPGIRPAWSAGAADDQRRAATPAAALAAGADLLVIGRPIRNAPDPRAAARKVAAEIADYQASVGSAAR